MSISRKGSRQITVNNKKFRWKVSKNGVLHLVIFRNKGDRVMKVIVNYPKNEHKIIKPKEVKQFLLLALKDGLSFDNSIVYNATS